MADPTYRLSGVLMEKGRLEDFEGPLTLILHLLSKNKIQIADLMISELVDQYLTWLSKMEALDLEIASEFVVMASHLVYIKTKSLLETEEQPDELKELIASLESLSMRDAYAGIKAAAESLMPMYMRGGCTYSKPREYLGKERGYRYSHEASELKNAMLSVMTRDNSQAFEQELRLPLPQPIIYPVEQKTEELMERLLLEGAVSMDELISRCGSRTEVVATFIALLELSRDGRVTLAGDDEEPLVIATERVAEETDG
ncbi:MAG: segregation/condensation protein A [Oscillospiraceae bacterium]|nr:segregation/condensation protein A [Oscillospiraceae bacterium]